jgi:3-oxoacyl-[acyl-carrier protein] reductase
MAAIREWQYSLRQMCNIQSKMQERFSLKEKIALVTGARRGIGKSIALAFAEAGAHVVVCDNVIEDGELKSVEKEIIKKHGKSFSLKADITIKRDVKRLFQHIMRRYDRIDIVVNNAGISARGSLLELTEKDWDRVLDVNLKGYYLCCQEAAKVMISQRSGNMINLSSVVAFKALFSEMADILQITPEGLVYPVSKAGVTMLTRRVAWELARFNIRVNAIAPGQILTEMNSAYGHPEEEKRRSTKIPLGRMGRPEDIADVAVFLASDASSYMTGQTLVVDGGLLI